MKEDASHSQSCSFWDGKHHYVPHPDSPSYLNCSLVDERSGCRPTAERLVSHSQPCSPGRRRSQLRISEVAWTSKRAAVQHMTCTMSDIQLAAAAPEGFLSMCSDCGRGDKSLKGASRKPKPDSRMFSLSVVRLVANRSSRTDRF